MADIVRIISADSHVDIQQDRVLANLPEKYHDALPAPGQMAALQKMMEQKPHKQRKQAATQEAAAPTGGFLAVLGSRELPWEAAGRPGAYDPVRAARRHGHRPGGGRGPLHRRGGRRQLLRAGDDDAIAGDVRSVEHRRSRVLLARPEAPARGLPRADPRHRGRRARRSSGSASRRCARVATPALPARPRLRAVLGQGLRPAVGSDRRTEHDHQPARRHHELPARRHRRARPDAAQGHHAVAAADLHVGVARGLAGLGRARTAPRPEGRARGGRPRLDPLHARPARPHEPPTRLGPLRHADQGAPELLLEAQHGGDVRRGRARHPRCATTSASTTCCGRPTTRTPTRRGPSRRR